MSKVTPITRRKKDHILINLKEDVSSALTTGLEQIQLEHNAVPELSLNQIDLSTSFLGHLLHAPLLISSMTGGTPEAEKINIALAEAAQARNVAMGLGSQRATLEDPMIKSTYHVRAYAPGILLFANLGAVQLNYGFGIDDCLKVVEDVEANALFLHFNPLQEALQPEGDTNFVGLLPKIEKVCRKLPVPIVAKEVGWGLSANVAKRLVDVGIAAIDVSGAGGTSWSQVEMHRAETEQQRKLASTFVSWGIPTAQAILDVRDALPEIPIIASGGLKSGLDIAKCIALGANLGGMAGPFLHSAVKSTEAVVERIDLIIAEIRICMFATGCPDLQSLGKAQILPSK
ncbi:MAG: type 2 isopentenyl-diphosphate Delta-isomerase [Chloroflexi bacterium RBG_16_48_8]|nr:MAG: type 2 isopentenyl-diphosphate Delta-isomerase [Chloroflexi bacterium RBG_16_48_8]